MGHPEGDRFAKGQEICEIETSKIVNVLEAPFAGTLRRIIARVGDTLPVGAVLALVADSSVSDAELDAFAASLAAAQPAAPATQPAAPATQTTEPAVAAVAPSIVPAPANKPAASIGQTEVPTSLQGITDPTQVNATPHALRQSARLGVDLKKVGVAGVASVSLSLTWRARSLPQAAASPLRRRPFVPAKRRDRIPMIAVYRQPRWRAVWPTNWGSTCTTAAKAVHSDG